MPIFFHVKILFIQLRQIGDLLMCTPALRAAKLSYPDAEIHLLCEDRLKWVLQGNPNLSAILPVDKTPALFKGLSLRAAHYDAVVDCMGLPKTALTAFFSGAKIRTGFRKRGRTLFYSNAISLPDTLMYSAAHKLLLLQPLGIQSTTDLSLEIHPSPAEIKAAQDLSTALNLSAHQRLIAFSPVSRRDYKRWSYASYAHVCDQVIEKKDVTFLPLFGPGEEAAIEEVISHSRHSKRFVFPYTPPPFKAFPEFMKHCLFYFGNDNGIRHTAIIAGLKTATLFGPPCPHNWTPPNTQHLSIWGKDKLPLVTEEAVFDMLAGVFHD